MFADMEEFDSEFLNNTPSILKGREFVKSRGTAEAAQIGEDLNINLTNNCMPSFRL